MYQIAIFVNGGQELADALKRTVLLRVRELGCESEFISFLDESTITSRDLKAPLVAAYISTVESPARNQQIAALLAEGVLVIPAVPDLKRYSAFVFEELQVINGLELREDDPSLERLCSVLLEGLSLLRRTRRLFISYRRAETHRIAIQLYELLDARGFDVFLDTHSIRPGEPFQEILWQRLADTDVIVLLDSPGFLKSRWTEEELARANSTSIQILQLTWPSSTVDAVAAFSRIMPLQLVDFSGGVTVGKDAVLSDMILNEITVEVEALRARALAARYSYLVQEFCAEAASLGFPVVLQPQRFITAQPKPDVFVAAVPTIGVPDAVQYQEIEDEISKHVHDKAQIILLYDERGLRDKWIKHLEWLDRSKLRVRSMQVAQSAAWLRSLA